LIEKADQLLVFSVSQRNQHSKHSSTLLSKKVKQIEL